MLKLNKQSDYALIIVSQLNGKTDFVPLSELIRNTRLPHRFLARIGAVLVNRGILLSKEGRVGGYKLTEEVKNISLYDFFSIFEKNLSFVECGKHTKKCKYEGICTHKHKIENKLNSVVLAQLQQIKLLDILR